MSNAPDLHVSVTRRYEASQERVFDAWLDPATARQWLFTTSGGEVVRAEIDARVGGTWVVVDRRDGQDVVHTGEYLEIERPRRLVFTFSVDGSEADAITVEIVPVEGGCELTLSHDLRPEWVEYLDRTQQGWGMILDGLGQTVL